MHGLLPVDPEVQKAIILSRYERDFQAASYLFTDLIKARTLNLMKFVINCTLHRKPHTY